MFWYSMKTTAHDTDAKIAPARQHRMLENLIVAELQSMDTGMTTDMTSSCIYKYKKSVPNNVVAYYCSVERA